MTNTLHQQQQQQQRQQLSQQAISTRDMPEQHDQQQQQQQKQRKMHKRRRSRACPAPATESIRISKSNTSFGAPTMTASFSTVRVVMCLCVSVLLLSCVVPVESGLRRQNGRPRDRNRDEFLADESVTAPLLARDSDPQRSLDAEGRAIRTFRLKTDPAQKPRPDGDFKIEIPSENDDEMDELLTFTKLTQKDDDDAEHVVSSFYGSTDPTSTTTLNMVTLKGEDGKDRIAATVIKDARVFQIIQRDDDKMDVMESQFTDSEVESSVVETAGDEPDVDPDSIDKVDVPDAARRRQLEELHGQGNSTLTAGRRKLNDDGSVLDIMVIYTRGAMCAAAGINNVNCAWSQATSSAIVRLINLAVAETNTAYSNSGIATRLRLVHTHFDGSYNDYTRSWEQTLSLLRNNGDGQLDYVHAMRNQYGADFVSMMVDTGSYCGIGYRPDRPSAADAFSLAKWSCATGYFSFGHEVAHNMGCNHDYSNSQGNGIHNYGYKYESGSNYNDRFRTIMSYDCQNGCPRIQMFSNPYKYRGGKAVGSSRANNAKWIQERLSIYAKFRTGSGASYSTGAQPTNPPFVLTPSPTPAPTVGPTPAPGTGELTTAMDGGLIGGAGNIFDVKAKKDITVTNFAVHSYAITMIDVEVYRKITPGSAQGFQSDPAQWELIANVRFQANGEDAHSMLPIGSVKPTFVPAGQIQAFYVTFTAATNYNRYSSGTDLNKVLAENDDAQIYEGYAKGYGFGDDYYPRVWNGAVYYDIGSQSVSTPLPTPPPTPLPTLVPTPLPTPVPTQVPTPLPTNPPVDEPSVPPTPWPTPLPTLVPTPLPTTMAPTPLPTTMAPSRLPTDSDQVVEELVTSFQGGNGQAGNMIDVVPKEQITVQAFDIHTSSFEEVTVLIYTKEGTYEGYIHDMSAWTLICHTTLAGAGSSTPTHVPASAVQAVTIEAGATQAFYVTLTESVIRYTNGIIVAEDNNLSITSSAGNRYPFGESFPNRIWNGVLYYTAGTGEISNPPSPTPNEVHGPQRSLRTTFANRNGSYGIMFDIVAKKRLLISGMAIHTHLAFGALVEVEVYKLIDPNLSYLGFEAMPEAWERVCRMVVEGQGSGNPTYLPNGAIDAFEVEEGAKQGLYVTIIGGGQRYSNGVSADTANLAVSVENDDMVVYEGSGIGAPQFGGSFFGRVFNGIITYHTPDDHTSPDLDSRAADMDADLDTEERQEGWTCATGDDCNSGKCGTFTGEGEFKAETLHTGGANLSDSTTPNQASSMFSLRSIFNRKGGDDDEGGNRKLTAEFHFCLNENGEHEEDGDLEHRR